LYYITKTSFIYFVYPSFCIIIQKLVLDPRASYESNSRSKLYVYIIQFIRSHAKSE